MKKLVRLLPLILALAGCATDPTTGKPSASRSLDAISAALTKANADVAHYAPIVGKDLLLVGNILVQAECSPAMGLASQATSNVLKITAPNSASATKVESILATNTQVAQQLCPLVSAIEASVGQVPAGAPSQTVPAAPAAQ